MRILTRYIIRDLIAPTLLGFGFYTFLILIKNLFDFAEMIIKRSLPLGTVIELLAWTLPHIVVLTIPMSLLFGILIAVGRLSSDSEIIAMRAAGLSTGAIFRPVLYFSLAIFAINLFLMNVVLPAGNRALQDLKADLFTSSFERELKPGVFFDDYENLMIYVNDVEPANGIWKGVLISDTTRADSQRIVVAERGRLSTTGRTKQVWLDLTSAETHVTSRRKSDRYELNRNAVQRVLLKDADPTSGPIQRSFRELNVRQLASRLRADSLDPSERRIVLVEIHKKFSIPFACVAFSVIGLPLGLTNRRGGKSSGFTLSIAIILIYYILINNGEDFARNGTIAPALAMWLPNLILIGFGMFMMRRANRQLASHRFRFHEWFERLVERIRHRRIQRAAMADDASDSSFLDRLDIPFPNTIDRYILREFSKILGLVLLSTAVLFLIGDYTELVEDISANQIPFDVVASYYRYFVLQVLNWTLPLSVLFATLITFGILSKNNEVTALKAHGTSLYRIALPVIAVAIVISGLSYLLLDFVLPYSNERMNQLRDRIKGRNTATAFSLQQKQWVFGNGRSLFNFLSYDESTRSLSEVQVFEFDPLTFRLTRRVAAEEARFDGTGWVFFNGWIRTFEPSGKTDFTPIVAPLRLHYSERPDYFQTESKRPNQMTFLELRRYVQNLRLSGYSADELSVKLYEKTSWPFISLVMALIGLPFAFRLGKRGSLHGIGVAILVAVTYWMLFGIFTKFGEVGNLPAVLSAWSANVLFTLVAVYLFLRVET